MKKVILLSAICGFIGLNSNAQGDLITGSEIGIDIALSASTNGGNAGLGLKYGFNMGEYFIVGPSARYEYLWWKNYIGAGSEFISGNRHVFGGGVFAHARFWNALFVGMEFEMLRSPYSKIPGQYFSQTGATWAPTLFLGGGFSMEFNETVRLNAGIMYDVINAQNSPFRESYFLQKKTSTGQAGAMIPLIYRIAFFFPLSR